MCFLLAFSCFIQSSRSFIHATYLISTPDSNIPAKNVEVAVIRACDFWSFGLRALYFALSLLLWFFGPIPMFATSVAMVLLLHYLDTNTTPLHRHDRPRGSLSKGLIGEWPEELLLVLGTYFRIGCMYIMCSNFSLLLILIFGNTTYMGFQKFNRVGHVKKY